VTTDSSSAGTPTWKRAAQTALSLAIVAGIFLGIMPQIADYGEVWNTITAMTPIESSALLLIGLWNLVTYWFVLTAALPGLRFREAAVVNQASTAVSNTLPAGGAIGVGVTVSMLTSWGFRLPAIGLQTVISGIWNNFVKLGMPVLALVLLALEGDVTLARAVSAAIGVAALLGAILLLALVLKSDRLARIVGQKLGGVLNRLRRVFRKAPLTDLDARASRFRGETVALLARRWIRLTLSTLISHISLYLVLLVALRDVGVAEEELSWITVLAAFAFVRLISALPLTPGGVGVVELGYAAVLTIGLNDMVSAQVVAAILLFRAITYLLPIPLGVIAYLVWRANRSWRLSPEERDVLAAI
jgi:putative heme transporter